MPIAKRSGQVQRLTVLWAVFLSVLVFGLGACRAANQPAALVPDAPPAARAAQVIQDAAPALPTVSPPALDEGERLRVVATTNLVADVVARVGGDSVDLHTLIPLNADPHSYTATPQDLRWLSEAHVIFVNGLGLEESLLPALRSLETEAPLVSVNAGVPTLALDGEAAHADEPHTDAVHTDGIHSAGVDPHTWLDVMNVAIWAENVAAILSEMDPAHAADYHAAAAAYQAELEALDAALREEIATLPPQARKLVTDHHEWGYFAAAYGFEQVGAVLPAYSTMAAASAQELAALQDQIAAAGVPAIFVGTTVNPNLAQQIAADLGIAVVPLYTSSLSDADGPAATYVEMMRYDVRAIVDALQP